MTLKTTDLQLAHPLSPEGQANILVSLNSSRLFDAPQDPRVTRPRPQFEFAPCGEAEQAVLRVTSDRTDHPNVLRLVKVILRLN